MVDEHFDDVDADSDGEIDEAELQAAMDYHHNEKKGGKGLAQAFSSRAH